MSGVTDNYGLILPAAGEAYDVDIINQNNVSIDTLLKTLDKKAQGIVTDKYTIAPSVGITDGIVENFPSVSFKGGRRYEITWEADCSINTAGNYFELSVNTCAVADAANLLTGLTQLDGSTITCNAINAPEKKAVTASYIPGGDTTLQIKFRAKRTVGGGGINISVGAGRNGRYVIRDMGKI